MSRFTNSRVLSNGRYHVMLTDAATGVSEIGPHQLTGWSPDRCEDRQGWHIYLRDRDSGDLWSAGLQPVSSGVESFHALRLEGGARFERVSGGIRTQLDVCVAPDCDAELRTVTVSNQSTRPRRIELTSYFEIVLNFAAAHAAHPAFAKLFVETEWDAKDGALLARRRPRAQGEQWPWLLHAMVEDVAPQFESDRTRFIGRGRSVASPIALSRDSLSGAIGSVLDPVAALRHSIELAPGESTNVTFVLAVGPERDPVVEMLRRLRGRGVIEKCRRGAAAAARQLRARLGLSTAQAARLEQTAVALRYGDLELRSAPRDLVNAAARVEDLDLLGLDAAAALVVAQVQTIRQLRLVEQLRVAQQYWQALGQRVQFVVLLSHRVVAAAAAELATAGDSLFQILRESELRPDTRASLMTAAHWLLRGTSSLYRRPAKARAAVGPTANAALHVVPATTPPARTAPDVAAEARQEHSSVSADGAGLQFWNGYGGFSPDGSEYVMHLRGRERPPMPWVNVIANSQLGTLVSESGAACTWSRNSREQRLTPWSNDPVTDPSGEALYLRDTQGTSAWSALPEPMTSDSAYEVRHGIGYSSWRHRQHDIDHEVCVFVSRTEPVKVTWLRLTNRGATARRLMLYSYARWVLGGLPEDSGRFVVTEYDSAQRVILARNKFSRDFADGIAFFCVVAPETDTLESATGDRESFIGIGGTAEKPAAVCAGVPLDGRFGAVLDPCAAFCTPLELPPNVTVECTVLLGDAANADALRGILSRYQSPGATERGLNEARSAWQEILGKVQVSTPDRALDLMLNGWLLYQVLSCRLWARSAFYQSGGAIGFRDQLQDSCALVYAQPDLTRAQILLHAAHQFPEGDVLHWWHPPLSRGTRTRFADDLLWLPFVTAFYVGVTGDHSILDEPASFVSARALQDGEDEAYLLPTRTRNEADVYTHCCLALDRSLTRGAHGLPLMGTGDWNDGMNRVGREGRGESVWMGFFLAAVIDKFAPLCEQRGEAQRARRYRDYRADIARALNEAGWDGAWYRRAYYDDGTPLGSAENVECRVDALVQAWSVLSGIATSERAAQALSAVMEHLVDRSAGIIKLLAPPFDRDAHDPGYIKGYVPGIRENGGQYTHAAVWTAQAFAAAGRRDLATDLFTMLLPIRHATADRVATYQVEPYVVAADIYGVPPHVGRGGWTWYTGSAGWMYRVGLETLLGVTLESGHRLRIRPCIPDAWPSFTVSLRLGNPETVYEVHVVNPHGTSESVVDIEVDGAPINLASADAAIPLDYDGKRHLVQVTLGPRA